jgi:hypothetical protein
VLQGNLGLPSGRFPDLANLPTQIAPEGERPISGPPPTTGFVSHVASSAGQDPEGFSNGSANLAASVPPAATGFANAPTAPATPKVPSGPSIFAPLPKVAPPAQSRDSDSAFSNIPTMLAPPAFPEQMETEVAPLPPELQHLRGPAYLQEPNGARPAQAPHASEMPTMPPTAMPVSYPVMSAELSEQIATGASVFPSEGRAAPRYPGDAISRSGPRSIEPSPLDGYPRVGDSGPGRVQHDAGPSDSQRAANLMSPVGEHYPEQVDWSAAAAAKARAVPPWLLALLFIGAIGIALGLTIVIAKIVS